MSRTLEMLRAVESQNRAGSPQGEVRSVRAMEGEESARRDFNLARADGEAAKPRWMTLGELALYVLLAATLGTMTAIGLMALLQLWLPLDK